jgi:hypothetical protein
MKRIIKVLVVSALMVVLMAVSAPTAFASGHQGGDPGNSDVCNGQGCKWKNYYGQWGYSNEEAPGQTRHA